MKAPWRALLLLLFLAGLPAGFCETNAQDVAALQSLMSQWQKFSSSWQASNDPCGSRWDGVMCTNGRVTSLRLSSINLKGTLSDSIGQLSELVYLDVSFNIGLGGPLPASIGNLAQLTTLILAGCSFTGGIPQELGNLKQMSFLALNSNKFTGRIPASIGLLSNLFWLDLADNQLSGPIPISSATSPGLDLLTHTKHFHFNKNQLTGNLTGLFNSAMTLIHVLFDNNLLSGSIPAELGGVTTLQVLRLDKNKFGGQVPANISNLVNLNEMNLADNQLTGSLPDLSSMTNLNVVDLSNNSFDPSVAPTWFSTLTSLTSVAIASGALSGQVPRRLFTSPQLQQVVLSNNAFNGTLEMTGNISPQLQSVNLLNNRIVAANITQSYKNTLVLVGNPVCVDPDFSDRFFCSPQQKNKIAYTTSVTICASTSCPTDQSLDPANCGCAYPYSGKMVFRAPFFTDLTNSTTFQQLESGLWTELALRPSSVFLSDVHFNGDNYLQVQVRLFPSTGMTFNLSELIRIGFDLSNQTYKPPAVFGPYYFIADPYLSSSGAASSGKSQLSTGAIAGIAVACGFLLIALIFVAIFAILDWKKRLRIALGSARGLAYLHELADPPIIHRDVKSTNILLDDNLKAKVADFGLSKLVADTEKGHVSTQVKGTLGYLDPEYYMTQQLSEKSDVYSFGVVMLELLSGRPPIEKGRYIVREFRMAINPNDHQHYGLKDIVDPAIQDAAKSAGFRRFVQLAMECVEESASRRPTMSSVVKEIETMLQNEGINTSLSSAGSSATEFENARGAPRHPYGEPVITKGSNSSNSVVDELSYPEVIRPK